MEADSTDPAFVRLYHAEVEKALAAEYTQLQEMQAIQEDLRTSHDLVRDLPNRLSHPIFVPFGPHAFFPGQLQHTNELTVHLGARHYATVTAKHAAAVLRRREASIDKAIQACQQQVDAHKARLRLAGSEVLGPSGPEEREIRESYEESEALLATARRPAPDPRLSKVGASEQVPVARGGARRRDGEAAGAGRSGRDEDGEYARLLAHMDELEAAEEAARLRGDEEEEEGGDGLQGRWGGPGGRLGALQEASEEEREPDSDDEEEEEAVEGVGATGQGVAAGREGQGGQGPVSQGENPPAAPAQQAKQAAFKEPSRPPLTGVPRKPALKKGFLLASPAAPATPAPEQPLPRQQRASAAALASRSAEMAFSRERAFTGQVLERPAGVTEGVPPLRGLQQQALAQPPLSPGGDKTVGVGAGASSALHGGHARGGDLPEVRERVAGGPEVGQVGRSVGGEDPSALPPAGKKPSKFKQKLMGMEGGSETYS